MPGPGGNGGEPRNDDRFLKKVLQRGVEALGGISRTVGVEQLGAFPLFDHDVVPFDPAFLDTPAVNRALAEQF